MVCEYDYRYYPPGFGYTLTLITELVRYIDYREIQYAETSTLL